MAGGAQGVRVETASGIAMTSFLVGLSGAMMPGPVLTVTIGEPASRLGAQDDPAACGAPGSAPAVPNRARILRGALAGPLIVLGHGLLEIALVVAVVMGLGTLLVRQSVIGGIGILGGAVLVWMAVGMFRGLPTLSLRGAGAAGGRWSHHPILAGFLTSLSNPYWIVWWATIGLGYIALSAQLGALGLGAFYLGHILSDLVWYSGVSLTLALGHRLLSDRVYRGLIAVCAGFLLGFGVYFGYAGVRSFGA
jgi:threonine/homoserine/homoserine lactone efflux protein